MKFQRPNIRDIIEADIDILMDLAQLIEKYIPELSQYNPVGIVDELARTTRRELDFYNEGRNTEMFARNFSGERMIHIPKVFWEFTTSHVLTLERIRGIKISDLEALDREGIDRKTLAKVGARLILKQVFEDGFFHADPHPGNLFALKGGIIAPVDFGMTGRLDDELMGKLVLLYIGFIERDVEIVVRFMEDEEIIDSSVDLKEFRTDLSETIDRYHGIALELINMKNLLEDISVIIRKYHLRIPPNFMLLGRALGTYEEVGRILDPGFDMISETKPYVRKLIKKRLSFARIRREFLRSFPDIYSLMNSLPRDFGVIVRKVRKGELSVELQHVGLEDLILELDRSSNRISFSLIIAALIIGSSFIIQLEVGPRVFGYPVLGIIGFLFAGILGIWLVIAILRSKRL